MRANVPQRKNSRDCTSRFPHHFRHVILLGENQRTLRKPTGGDHTHIRRSRTELRHVGVTRDLLRHHPAPYRNI